MSIHLTSLWLNSFFICTWKKKGLPFSYMHAGLWHAPSRLATMCCADTLGVVNPRAGSVQLLFLPKDKTTRIQPSIVTISLGKEEHLHRLKQEISFEFSRSLVLHVNMFLMSYVWFLCFSLSSQRKRSDEMIPTELINPLLSHASVLVAV